MTPEQHHRAVELFEQLCDCASNQQGEFLRQVCNGDDELRHVVQAMLAADQHCSRFLEAPPGEFAAEAVANKQRPPSIGQSFGDYEVLECLGTGGMCEVFLAQDTRLGRKAALKFLSQDYNADFARLRRFEREACAVSALNHPNIVTVYGFGQVGCVHFIATEFIDGKNLREELSQGPLAPEAVVDIAIQAASALAAAHGAGIVHRDIKPENIMLRPDGLVKIVDFGLAKQTQSDQFEALAARVAFQTVPGLIVGTPRYMSPEQARGVPVDARTDLFSLGSVMYEILAATPAVSGANLGDILSSLLSHDPPPLETVRPDCPAGLVHVVRRALQKDRDKRYRSAEEMLTDLKSVRLGVRVTGETHPARLAHVHVKSRSGKRWQPWLMGTVLAVLCCVGLMTATHWRAPERLFTRGPAPVRIQSLAVLPFKNMSGDPQQEYFADGVTEELITELAKTVSVRVISHTSVMRYKTARKSVPEITKELNIDAVVEGAVLRSGNRIRLSVQLITPSPERHLWGDVYEGDIHDVLDLQRQAVRNLGSKLGANVAMRPAVRSGSSLDPVSYESYLRARHFLARRTADGMKKALAYFQEVLHRNAEYAPAYSGLALTYDVLGMHEVLPPEKSFPNAKSFASRALQLDDSLAEAYTARAIAASFGEFNWSAADQDFQRANALEPNSALAHHFYAEHWISIDRADRAVAEMQRARELDPLSLVENATLGRVYRDAHRYVQALEQCGKTLDLDPNIAIGHWCLGQVYIGEHRYAAGIRELELANTLGTTPLILRDLAWAYAATGQKAKAIAILGGLTHEAKSEYVSPYSIGVVHAALGEKDEAFRYLERAFAERDCHVTYLALDPQVDPLRSDPRFQGLLARLHIPR